MPIVITDSERKSSYYSETSVETNCYFKVVDCSIDTHTDGDTAYSNATSLAGNIRIVHSHIFKELGESRSGSGLIKIETGKLKPNFLTFLS